MFSFSYNFVRFFELNVEVRPFFLTELSICVLCYCKEVSETMYGPYAEDVSGHEDEVLKYTRVGLLYSLHFIQDNNVHN